MAMIASSTTLCTCSFRMSRVLWLSTVLTAVPNWWAASRTEYPWARRIMISSSRGVRVASGDEMAFRLNRNPRDVKDHMNNGRSHRLARFADGGNQGSHTRTNVGTKDQDDSCL